MKFSANGPSGQSLVEYGLFGALVIALPILALQIFGHSLSDLFTTQDQALQTQGALTLLTPALTPAAGSVGSGAEASGNPSNAKFSGYFVLVTDPATGRPELKLSGFNRGVTNATSVAGNQFNTLGTLRIARKLNELAQQQTDPALKDYYAKLAEQAYYMGAAEGELDDIPGLSIYSKLAKYQYTNGDGLQEVVDRRQALATLMQNPPVGFDEAHFQQVMPLAAEVFNIAQNYRNSLSNLLDANGNVPLNFGNNVAGDPNTGSGNRIAGSSMTMASNMGTASAIIGTHYADFVPYDTLKSNVAYLLDNNKIKSAPVETTLTDGRTMDQTGSTSQQ